jgi:pimeloyl-ACP methyl ester carboxylesterase
MVFISGDVDMTSLPAEWDEVLRNKRLLFVSPQKAANDQGLQRRMGLTVMGAMQMQKHYRIDKRRIYAAGYSGGARVVSNVAFHQPDVFRGTVQMCGSDFYRPVTKVHEDGPDRGRPYGLMTGLEPTKQQIDYVKRYVRFALITGPGDFRHGNILNIAEGGFIKDGFQAKVFDIPEMRHEFCNGPTLARAIDFLESGR